MANLIETAKWETGIYQLEEDDEVLGGAEGVDNRQAKQLANRTLYLKQEVEKRAKTESPTFTGSPKAPTPAQTVNDTTIATTAFVKSAIAALVGSAPATLDTLAEIATALGSDGNLKNTLLTEIGKKANQTDFTTLKNLLIGIPFPYPLAAVPSGCLAFNGQAFNKTTYPILAQKYPSGVLPDLRGEFIRGWDNGRGVDSGRGLLSFQKNAILQHFHGQKTSGGSFVVWGEHIPVGTTIFEVSDYLKGNTSDNNRMYIPTNTDSAGKAVWDGSRFTFSALTTEGVSMTENAWDWNDNIQNETRPRNIAFQYICLAA